MSLRLSDLYSMTRLIVFADDRLCPPLNRRQEANKIVDSYTGTYYLTSNIHIRNGATLEIDGDHEGSGDCETLLLVRFVTSLLL